MMEYDVYNLGFTITSLQNPIENIINATYNAVVYNFRVLNNPDNAIIYLDTCYYLKQDSLCYSYDKKLAFKLDENNNVLMYVAIE